MADHSNPTLRRAASLRLFGLFIFCCLFPPHFIGTFFFTLRSAEKSTSWNKKKENPEDREETKCSPIHRRRVLHSDESNKYFPRIGEFRFRSEVRVGCLPCQGW